MSDLWVFGYGSLLWNPGFAYAEAVPARLFGGHRSLCVYSWVHRGTRRRPGLVLGLDTGGSCRGVAFRVEGRRREAVLAYLRAREMVTSVYIETPRKVVPVDGRGPIEAVTYTVDKAHAQYAGRLTLDEQYSLVRDSRGRSGANRDYVLNTTAHLRELGVRDHALEQLARALGANA